MSARVRAASLVNVSTAGVQVDVARFSAYLASKAALDAFSRALAIEVQADGVRVTTVHPPLVHTPMSAASHVYENSPGLTPDEAADAIIEAVRTEPPRVAPLFSTAIEVGRLLAPSVVRAIQSRIYQRSLRTEAAIAPVSTLPAGKPGPRVTRQSVA